MAHAMLARGRMILRTIDPVFVAILILLYAYNGPCFAAYTDAQAIDDCNREDIPSIRLEGCSFLIETLKPKDPNLAIAYGLRGVVYLQQGAFDKAIQDYSEALKVEASPEHYYFRGLARYFTGDYPPWIWPLLAV